MSGCYESEGDTGEGRCGNAARYSLRLASTAMPATLLCVDHTAAVRAHWPDDVLEIHSLPVAVDPISPEDGKGATDEMG